MVLMIKYFVITSLGLLRILQILCHQSNKFEKNHLSNSIFMSDILEPSAVIYSEEDFLINL